MSGLLQEQTRDGALAPPVRFFDFVGVNGEDAGAGMGRLRRPLPTFPVVGHAGGASAPTTTPNHSRPY